MDPKIILKAPSAPEYTNVDGGGAKKTQFLVKMFQKKSLQNPFLACFFFKFACAAENLVIRVSL